ncbi:MAG: STAS/SEC14 domain-containing protein [Pseudomonadales bacterium]
MLGIGIDNAVAFSIAGKVSDDDMELVLTAAKEKIALHDSIVIFEQIDSFKGIELEAIVDEFNYLRKVGISNVQKVAVLTDKKWLARIVAIEDKLFRSIDMKCFSLDDKNLAIEFLQDQ